MLKQVPKIKKLIKERKGLWKKYWELSHQKDSFNKSLDDNEKEIKSLLKVQLIELFGENEIKNFAVDLWGGAGPDCIVGRLEAAFYSY